jgi:protein FRA10AC1
MDEMKAGKGEATCANISCTRTGDLEGMEVVFGYDEEEKHKNVLVKCVLCEKCGKKMRKARERDKSRKRSKREEHEGTRREDGRERSNHEKHERKRRRYRSDEELEEQRFYRPKNTGSRRRGTDRSHGDPGSK